MEYNELYHYGVKGMKWGVRKERRASRKLAKQEYKKRTSKVFKEYERTIRDIEQPYKKGRNLSDKDVKREATAEKKYREQVSKAETEYKQAKKMSENNARKETQKKGLTDKQKKAIKVGATVVGTALATYGAYKVSKYVKDKKQVIDSGKRFMEQQAYLQRNINNIQSHVDPAHKLYKTDKWRHAFQSTYKDRAMGIRADKMLWGMDTSNRDPRKETRDLMYEALKRGDYDKTIARTNNGTYKPFWR